MKVVVKDKVIVYINKEQFKNLDFKNKNILNNYIKKLIIKLKNDYYLEFTGYYNIMLYIDNNYGIIIEMKKEELEYLDYFTKGLEININTKEDSFLYEIANLNKDILNNSAIYTYNEKIYAKISSEINSIQLGKILENTNEILYGNKKNRIIKKIKQVKR